MLAAPCRLKWPAYTSHFMKLQRQRSSFFTRCARYAGGLFLGFKIHYPTRIWDGPYTDIHGAERNDVSNMTWDSIGCEIGFLFWELRFYIDYNHKPLE
jgi:hypothetical protein